MCPAIRATLGRCGKKTILDRIDAAHMGRLTPAQKKRAQAAAKRRGGPSGAGAHYADKQERRDHRRAVEAARMQAETGCGWAFGARCEAQFLAIARKLAEIFETRETLESELEWIADREAEEIAAGVIGAQLASTREFRAGGVAITWTDPATWGETEKPASIKAAALAETPEPGAWTRCPDELGRTDRDGLGLDWWHEIAVAHMPGDAKAKRENRALEVRFYDFSGPEIDPAGDSYWRLTGHVGATWTRRAIQDAVTNLIAAWGEHPADWRTTRREALADPETGLRVDGDGRIRLSKDVRTDANGRVLWFPLFPELARIRAHNLTPGAPGKGSAGA